MKKGLSHTDPLRQSYSAARDGIAGGFTLIELSVVMAIVAMLLSFSLSAFTSVQDSQSAKLNREKLQMVQDAIEEYLREYGHLPCVANRSLPPVHPDFGISFTTVSNDPCSGAGLAPAYMKILPVSAGDPVWIGSVPVRDLGIPESLAYDAYGNRFTYVVTEGQTDPATYAATAGEIIVLNAANLPVNTLGTIGYILISHGKSGFGAFNHKSGIQKACNIATKDGENCMDDNEIFTDIARNTGTIAANFFDDSIVWNTGVSIVSSGTPMYIGGAFVKEGAVWDHDDNFAPPIFDTGYDANDNGTIAAGERFWQVGTPERINFPQGVTKVQFKINTNVSRGTVGCTLRNQVGTMLHTRVSPRTDGGSSVDSSEPKYTEIMVSFPSVGAHYVTFNCPSSKDQSVSFQVIECDNGCAYKPL